MEGKATVIIYANRNIKKGEMLFYDYNEAGFNTYPTDNFIWRLRWDEGDEEKNELLLSLQMYSYLTIKNINFEG